MLFSVIVPVYNVEKYLDECVRSVLDQTFKDWEMILVDDGSTDSSGEICDKYQAEYPDKIKVFHKKNEGQLLTRCYGIRNSAGLYFVFLDSDDKLRDDCLEKLSNVITEYESDMIVYKYSKSPDYANEYILPLTPGILEKQDVYDLICTSSWLNNLCTKCVKRDCCDIETDYSKYYYVKNAEDLLQSLPIIDKSKRPYYLDEALYYYRTNPQSIIHTYQPSYLAAKKVVLNETYIYSKKWNVDQRKWEQFACFSLLESYKYIIKSNLILKQKINTVHKMMKDDFFKLQYNGVFLKTQNLKNRLLYLLIWVICKL